MSESTSRSERRRRFQSPSDSAPPASDVSADVPLTTDSPPPAADSLAGGGDDPELAEGWLPLDDYSRSGVRVIVRSVDGDEMEAKYHQTRRYNAAKIRWEPYARWVGVAMAGAYVPFEPVQYRPLR
jgi:hypothetical protein